MEARRSRILVVDDVAENIRVVGEILRPHYDVKLALNGPRALELAGADEPPDLILLDVVMPGMDGYAVCRSLRERAGGRDIPVIFLSALSETADKVKAFQEGGVDYVTKPFEPEEVLARVRTHLELLQARQEATERNRQLQESLSRAKELEHLRDNLVHMMAHDMRSPLMSLGGTLEILDMDVGETLGGEQRAFLSTARGSCRKLVDMVSAMLDVSKLEAGQMQVAREPADVADLARQSMKALEGIMQGRNVSFHCGGERSMANVDPDLTQRVINNLLGNALKFTPPDGRITLAVRLEGPEILVEVADTGPGVPIEHHERIFEKFGQVQPGKKRVAHSTGLGLTFCKLAVEGMGGRIGLTSETGRGSTFWFGLPRV